MQRGVSLFSLVLLLVSVSWAEGKEKAALPTDAEQLIIAVADTWDSSRATLWTLDRNRRNWSVAKGPTPVLLGRNGLAWGIGVASDTDGLIKREGDGRTPAGLFRIGQIYGYPDARPDNLKIPFVSMGSQDAWVDDPQNPYYNQHVRVTPGQEPPWFQSQRVRLGDAAYRLKVEIRHNSDPPVPGYGSAIFFHFRRGPDRVTAGCTTMADADLLAMIDWLDASRKPHYVILPRAEYLARQNAWKLPDLPMNPR